jgi:RNA polymerase sigma-70 factor (ECF subfamily)
MTDSEVVQRVLEGDSGLFETLMRRHNQRVYRAVRAVLRSDDEAEDVLQQAYLNAYKHLDQFAGDAQFSTWLTRIAVNQALAHRRKRGIPFEDQGEIEVADTRAPDPERQAVASELRHLMEQEVESLPDAFRTTFVMREVEGLSTNETAETLGISEDLVKTRLHRARALLRDNLYKRAGVTVDSLFEFGNSRCDRVVNAVMTQITAGMVTSSP